ncbi:hypothetical protein [Pseudoalteromonas galatheae]|uniref:hypothetical protein n=1 Tax=Pseudoalteromonas galatheae TaxID=579562 RepID=UPI0030CFF5C3
MKKSLVQQYAKLEAIITQRHAAINEIEGDFLNWYGKEGYEHVLKAGPKNRIRQHRIVIDNRYEKQRQICKQLTYQEFMEYAEQFDLYDIAEDDYKWKE